MRLTKTSPRRPQHPTPGGTPPPGEPPQQVVGVRGANPQLQLPPRPQAPAGAEPGTPAKAGDPSSGAKEPYKADLRPGKMVVCKNCGCIGPDFNACIRCKKKIPEDAKVIDDPDKPKPRIIAKVGRKTQGHKIYKCTSTNSPPIGLEDV